MSDENLEAPPVLAGEQAMLPTETAPTSTRKPRGFAAMSPAARSAIAAKGGKAAHQHGTAHRFTSEKAKEAGRKGGTAPHVRRGRQAAPSAQRELAPAK